MAVDWTLRHPALDGAIVGFRRPDQVDPILVATRLELSQEDVGAIEGGSREGSLAAAHPVHGSAQSRLEAALLSVPSTPGRVAAWIVKIIGVHR